MTTAPEQRLEEAFAAMHASAALKERTAMRIERSRSELRERAEASSESIEGGKPASVSSHERTTVPSAAKRSRPPRNPWKIVLPLAACLLLAAIGLGTFALPDRAVEPAQDQGQGSARSSAMAEQVMAYVGIDVNPSLELALSERDTVVEAQATNDDGAAVIAAVPVVGLPYEEALALLLSSETMVAYLADDALVEISVTSEDEELAQILVDQSDRLLAQLPYAGHCQQVNSATRAAAHAAGMGTGKYCVAAELMALDDAFTVENCAHMSMRELRDAVAHCRGDAARSSETCQRAQDPDAHPRHRYRHHAE